MIIGAALNLRCEITLNGTPGSARYVVPSSRHAALNTMEATLYIAQQTKCASTGVSANEKLLPYQQWSNAR